MTSFFQFGAIVDAPAMYALTSKPGRAQSSVASSVTTGIMRGGFPAAWERRSIVRKALDGNVSLKRDEV